MPEQKGSAGHGDESIDDAEKDAVSENGEEEAKDTGIAASLLIPEDWPLAPNAPAITIVDKELNAFDTGGDEASDGTQREEGRQTVLPLLHSSNDSSQNPITNDIRLDLPAPPSPPAVAFRGNIRERSQQEPSIPAAAAGGLPKKRIDAGGGLVDAPRQRDIGSFFAPKVSLRKPAERATPPPQPAAEGSILEKSEPQGLVEAVVGAEVQTRASDEIVDAAMTSATGTEEQKTEEHQDDDEDDAEEQEQEREEEQADNKGADEAEEAEDNGPVDRAANYRALIANESKAEKLRRKARIFFFRGRSCIFRNYVLITLCRCYRSGKEKWPRG